VSRLLFAIDAELEFKVVRFKDKKRSNEFHVLNAPSINLIQPSTAGTTDPSPHIEFAGSL
jgi:hypothetical protein